MRMQIIKYDHRNIIISSLYNGNSKRTKHSVVKIIIINIMLINILFID